MSNTLLIVEVVGEVETGAEISVRNPDGAACVVRAHVGCLISPDATLKEAEGILRPLADAMAEYIANTPPPPARTAAQIVAEASRYMRTPPHLSERLGVSEKARQRYEEGWPISRLVEEAAAERIALARATAEEARLAQALRDAEKEPE